MSPLGSAVWAESLKALRSRVPFVTALGFCLMPAVGGLFMIILKDPEAARSMGLISAKAQLTAGSADWPGYLAFMAQAVAAGGGILFSIIAIWAFGREFSDHTVKEVLALPTPRSAIVSAKFLVVAMLCLVITLAVLGLSMVIGHLVDIPGWSAALARSSLMDILGGAIMTVALVPFAALAASAGRGYLPAFGWTILTVVLAQLAAVLGWGDWFPWAIPALFSGAAGPRAGLLGWHSYIVLAAASVLGILLTYWWWRDADQPR